jgi:HD superfamily phosphohydrolase
MTPTSLPNCVENESPFRPRQIIEFTSPNTIKVTDALYGTITITDPVLLALIQDASFRRLRGIHQHGITPIINVNKVQPPMCRFEHSLGAMLLVRSLAPHDMAQQCAALIHDISHTVLSHVTDYAFGYIIHEVEKEQYVETTAIPQILGQFGYDWKYITSEEPGVWTVLEQPAPLLCADRVDYGLRDIVAFDVLPRQTVRAIVEQFIAYDGRIMCTDVNLARDLARGYMQCDMLAWANPHHSGLYNFAGDAIRLALAHEVIRKDELWLGTDAEFWDKIMNCGIKEIDEKTRYVNEFTTFKMVSSPKDGEIVQELTLKIRTIDPEILVRQDDKVKVQRLTELDEEFAKERQDYINSKSKPIYLAVS